MDRFSKVRLFPEHKDFIILHLYQTIQLVQSVSVLIKNSHVFMILNEQIHQWIQKMQKGEIDKIW